MAIFANFFDKEDIAHTSYRVGVTAFDSSRVHYILDSFGKRLRQEGGGYITWTYIDEPRNGAECDFLLVNSIEACRLLKKDSVECFLAASADESGRFPQGVVFVKNEGGGVSSDVRTFAFPDSGSASCYLSTIIAMREGGNDFSSYHARIEFAECRTCLEQLIFGVYFGAYYGSAIDRDRYERMIHEKLKDGGVFKIIAEGERVPELVLLTTRPMSEMRSKRLKAVFMGVFEDMPAPLKRDMFYIGIGGFVPVSPSDLSEVEAMLSRFKIDSNVYHP